MYHEGEGITQNYIRAYLWLSVSAALGYEDARSNLDIVRGKLTKSELSQAQELATRCFESNFQDCE